MVCEPDAQEGVTILKDMSTPRKRKQTKPGAREDPAKRRKQQCTAPYSEAERIARRLYVHGVDITKENRKHLLDYLNTRMQRKRLCRNGDRAIVDANCRTSVLIFANSAFATKALQLNGVDFCGSKLSFERDPEYEDGAVDEEVNRKLHVRRRVITEDTKIHLIRYLTGIMRSRSLCGDSEHPIIDTDNSFLVFKNNEMATRALKLNGIDFCGSSLAFERPRAYSGPPDVAVRSAAEDVRSSDTDESSSSDASIESSLAAFNGDATRQLYVRRLVVTDENRIQLIKYLTIVMRSRGLCGRSERPILYTNKYFLCFTSAVMATRALQLNGIDFCGSSLTFERPRAYSGPPDVAARSTAEDVRSSDADESSSSDESIGCSTSATSNKNDKIALRLYISVKGEYVINDTTRKHMLRFLNGEMQSRELCKWNDRPFLNAHLDFIICESAETVLLALQLNNVSYCGSRLLFQRSNEGECSLLLRKGCHIKVKENIDFINKEMQKRKLCERSEQPLVTYFNKTLVFTTATMANHAYSLNGIDCQGSVLSLDRHSDYTGPPETVDTTVAKTHISWTPGILTQSLERPDEEACRLYVGGVFPNEESKGSLLHFLNVAMQERHRCSSDERPLVKIEERCLIFVDSDYATRALCLEGIEFDGCMLTFERPKGYDRPGDLGPDEVILKEQIARRLCVTGTDLQVQSTCSFIQFLNEKLLVYAPIERSIVDVAYQATTASTFAWTIYFKTADMASHALNTFGVIGADYNGSILTFTRPNGYTNPANDILTNAIEAEEELEEPPPPDEPSKYGTNSADSYSRQMADLESALEEMGKDRDSKQKQLLSANEEKSQLKTKIKKLERQELFRADAKDENAKLKQINARLEEDVKSETKTSEELRSKLARAEARIQRMGEMFETVSKKREQAYTQVKEEEGKLLSMNEESTHLKTKIEKLERQEHSRTVVNEQLVLENCKLKQMNAQLEEADGKKETKTTEELRSKLESAEQRNQRMGEILANSMEELISERKNLRALEARMETSLHSENAECEKAEREAKDLRPTLATTALVNHEEEWEV